ncbi:hypothetical protein GPJ56_000856 [Histomonas meleagridis]|uniref:uncharacterized protein n=1 Tax=Histomonas meleagridis TaxID=135588 RepID=UPI003559C1DF|nr:hypothetical protein GPJ56_000856 [Histomonas meleagridis]KAH0801312.1 hypothetical protein GO595_005907 [Histomonas meleagridis]
MSYPFMRYQKSIEQPNNPKNTKKKNKKHNKIQYLQPTPNLRTTITMRPPNDIYPNSIMTYYNTTSTTYSEMNFSSEETNNNYFNINKTNQTMISSAIERETTLKDETQLLIVEETKHQIPEGQEGRYANLYSLISTIESLEDEYCNGYITSEEHNKLFSELQSQFNTVQNALNLTTEDIRTFCNHCKLSGSYAFAALFNSTPEISTSLNHSNNVDLQQAVALGTDFTTLSDYCMVDAVTAGQYLQLIRQIKGRLQSMNILQQNEEAKNITDYWLDVFEKMKPNDKVPNDIIEKLKSQIGVWRTSAIETMH